MKPAPCSDRLGSLASLAVDAGGEDPRELAELVAHVAGCPGCAAEFAALRADVQRARVAAPATPAAGEEPRAGFFEEVLATWRRERAGVDDAALRPTPLQPVELPDQPELPERSRRWRPSPVVVAVAAALVLVLLAAGVLWSRSDGRHLPGDAVVFATVPRGASASAVLAPGETGGTVVRLSAEGLEPGLVYAVWMATPGGGLADRVPAGTFRVSDDGTVDVRLVCAWWWGPDARVWATTPEGRIALDTEPPA